MSARKPAICVSSPRITSAGSACDRPGTIHAASRPGAAVGAPVTLRRAVCQMILEPGQQPPRLRDLVASELSFSAIQIL